MLESSARDARAGYLKSSISFQLSVIPTNVGIHCAELSRFFRATIIVMDPDVRRDD